MDKDNIIFTLLGSIHRVNISVMLGFKFHLLPRMEGF